MLLPRVVEWHGLAIILFYNSSTGFILLFGEVKVTRTYRLFIVCRDVALEVLISIIEYKFPRSNTNRTDRYRICFLECGIALLKETLSVFCIIMRTPPGFCLVPFKNSYKSSRLIISSTILYLHLLCLFTVCARCDISVFSSEYKQFVTNNFHVLTLFEKVVTIVFRIKTQRFFVFIVDICNEIQNYMLIVVVVVCVCALVLSICWDFI